MKKGKTLVVMVGTALIAALMAVSGTGCRKEDERALRKGRIAEALGYTPIAEVCYGRAAAMDNAEGVRRLAELLLGEGATLFGEPREHDEAWISEATALTARIGPLLRTAQLKGENVDEIVRSLNSYNAAIYKAREDEERRRTREARIRNGFWEEAVEAVEQASQKTAAVLGSGRTPGETKTLILPGRAEMEMVWCPPGTFLMGSPENEPGRDDDEAQHQVTLTKGFWMAKHEVTQKQWKSVMGDDPSYDTSREDQPVEQVSWYDCMEFCWKAGMRLPTEAQWEYACRAGASGPFSDNGRPDGMGWYYANARGKTHPVGKKAPNAWGIHDMHGNVSEWCADVYGQYPGGAVTDPSTRGASGSARVLRGGNWGNDAQNCRSATRSWHFPSRRLDRVGFRPCAPQDCHEAPNPKASPTEPGA